MYPKLTERVISLARRTRITDADWLELLQERADALKESLRSMTLRQLDEIKFIHDYFHEHGLRKDNPRLISADDRFSIDMRGIFPSDRSWGSVSHTTHHRASPDLEPNRCAPRVIAMTERFWGLSRNGEWVGIEVYVAHSEEPYKNPGRTERVARAQTVSIHEYPLAELCEFSQRHPRVIWDRLGEAVDEWVRHRQALLDEAERIQELFNHESSLLNTIAPRR